jgi:hypothetical protein
VIYVFLPGLFWRPKPGHRFFSLFIGKAGRNGDYAMTREDRRQELNVLRKKDPERLIATYRSATNTPERGQLPRGLGFTGMIEAILEHEVATGELHDEVQQVVPIASTATNCVVEAAERRRARMVEFKAFCGGGAMVFTGLLLAVLYLLLTQQILA